MKYIITIVTITLLTGAGCKKNITDQLPPETHEGKFTFGCKVDGKVYTAWGKGGGVIGLDHVSYTLVSSDSSIHIFAGTADDSKPKFSISLTIRYLGNLEIYQMKNYPYYGMYLDESNGNLPGSSNTYNTNDVYNGSVNVTYFNGSYIPYNKGTILSGTFEMDAVNEEGIVIHITEGRFDIGQ